MSNTPNAMMVSPVREVGSSNEQSHVSQTPENSLIDDTKIDLTLSSASKGSGDKDKIIGLE